MPRKTKIEKTIKTILEKSEMQNLQPYTWIKCKRENMLYSNIKKNKLYLFVAWITNPAVHNVVLLDERGVFTTSIEEEDFEVLK